VRGVAAPLDVEEQLANLISDHISPRLVPEIEVLPWRRKNVVAVNVFPSASRPHHLAREGLDNGVYVRVGSTNRRADQELIGEMRRLVRGDAFDEQPMPELNSEDIDFRAASGSFAGIRRLTRRDLDTLRLVTKHQGRTVPTHGGIILFGRDREQWFPDAWIQAGRFSGADKTHIVDQLEIRSLPVQAIEDAVEFVEKHSLRGAQIGRVRRRERWSIPPIAIREAVINAVAHADYSQRGAPIRLSMFDDRVEIENPGILPLGLTIDDVTRGVSKLRNRVIGRVFHSLGLVEQWGSGVQRMINACRDMGLTPPQFEELATRFRVTIFTALVSKPTRDATERAIIDALAGSEGLSTSEIAKIIGLSPRATRTRLLKMVDSGGISEIGAGATDPRKLYVTRASLKNT
jgi:ATP-dependent DNA helicase RecG